jgi:hypothetical protein
MWVLCFACTHTHTQMRMLRVCVQLCRALQAHLKEDHEGPLLALQDGPWVATQAVVCSRWQCQQGLHFTCGRSKLAQARVLACGCVNMCICVSVRVRLLEITCTSYQSICQHTYFDTRACARAHTHLHTHTRTHTHTSGLGQVTFSAASVGIWGNCISWDSGQYTLTFHTRVQLDQLSAEVGSRLDTRICTCTLLCVNKQVA